MRSIFLALVGFVSLTLPMPVQSQGFAPDTILSFKHTPEAELRLHVFTPPGHRPTDRRPALIFFFGGAWNKGSPEQFFPHASYFASRGLVAIAAEYRIRSAHGTTPFESLRDAKSAIRWVRAHARELGVDSARIAAGGGSAGGHLAAAAGMLTGFEEPAEDSDISSRPDALVLFNPVVDNGPGGWGYGRIGERYREFSPMHNVRSTAPPTVVFLGTADRLIPVTTIRRFAALMREAGVRCDVHLYEGQEHGFFNYRRGDNPYYEETLRTAEAFLASLGYLD